MHMGPDPVPQRQAGSSFCRHTAECSDDSVSDIWGSSVLLHWTDLVELAPIWTQNFAFCGLIQNKSQDASLQTSLWTIMTFLLCTIDAQFSTLTDLPQRLWMARLARYMALYKSYIIIILWVCTFVDAIWCYYDVLHEWVWASAFVRDGGRVFVLSEYWLEMLVEYVGFS